MTDNSEFKPESIQSIAVIGLGLIRSSILKDFWRWAHSVKDMHVVLVEFAGFVEESAKYFPKSIEYYQNNKVARDSWLHHRRQDANN